jgi:hypothetical protein
MIILGIENALESLRPGSDWHVHYENDEDGVLNWLEPEDGQTEPTKAEIDTEIARLQDAHNALEYARNRASAYPIIGDQLDMIYKDNKNSTTTHADAVEVVKTKWPKDNSGPV